MNRRRQSPPFHFFVLIPLPIIMMDYSRLVVACPESISFAFPPSPAVNLGKIGGWKGCSACLIQRDFRHLRYSVTFTKVIGYRPADNRYYRHIEIQDPGHRPAGRRYTWADNPPLLVPQGLASCGCSNRWTARIALGSLVTFLARIIALRSFVTFHIR
jgi:hypothetical protein